MVIGDAEAAEGVVQLKNLRAPSPASGEDTVTEFRLGEDQLIAKLTGDETSI